MNKRETLDRINRLLLVIEGLPADAEVISVRVMSDESTVHLREGSGVMFRLRRRVNCQCVENSTTVAGVEVLEWVDSPVPEGV